jgi:hypothetical protein
MCVSFSFFLKTLLTRISLGNFVASSTSLPPRNSKQDSSKKRRGKRLKVGRFEANHLSENSKGKKRGI